MIYLVGIKVFTKLHLDNGVSFPGSTIVALITCLIVIIPLAELFHRLVQEPSKLLAHKFYDFITS